MQNSLLNLEISSNKPLVLVTGATGMLGNAILHKLLEKNIYQLRATFRTDHPETTSVEWVSCDLLDIEETENAVKNVDFIIHAAAMISYAKKDNASLIRNNINSTANLINAALSTKRIQKFLHISSVAAIGGDPKELITEKFVWNEKAHHSAYAISKFGAEMEVWRGAAEDLNISIFNPSIILGCGDWHKGSSAIFKSLYDGLKWYSMGEHGYVDVWDVADYVCNSIENKATDGQRIILNGVNISYQELFNKISRGFQKPAPTKKVTPLLAAVVWRVKAIKSLLTGKSSMITKESAQIALEKIRYDNSKSLQIDSHFKYHKIDDTIQRVCQEYTAKYDLKKC